MDQRKSYRKIAPISTVVKRTGRMGLVPAALLFVGTHCAEEKQESAAVPDPEPIIAQVGDRAITLEQFRVFSRDIPKYLQSEKTGIERVRNHLQTMIDRDLLAMEALAQGIDQSPRFLKKMRRFKEKRLLAIFQAREIRVKITQEEVAEYFEREGLSKTVRFDEILVEGEDKAAAALGELKAGKSFSEVSEKYSSGAQTAARGVEGAYSTRLDVHPDVRDALFSLEVGEVSEPVKRGENHFAIYKLTDAATLGLNDAVLRKIYRTLYIEKYADQKAAIAAKLRDEYGVEIDRAGWHLFLKKIDDQASFETAEERSITLYRHPGGKITAEDFIDAARTAKRPLAGFADSAQAVSFADRTVVANAVIVEAALRTGIHREEAVARALDERREQLLMILLREQLMEDELAVTAEEVRSYYDSHRDDFAKPKLYLQEILVDTEEEAQSLAEQVRGGASLGELAKTHSTRPAEQQDEEGNMHIHDFERARYSRLVRAAQEAPLGELTGPVEVKGGYSVFKVISREEGSQNFAQVKKRVEATVKWLRKQVIFEQYLAELREKYAAEVTIRENQLELAAGAG